jgi:hypothetical protein
MVKVTRKSIMRRPLMELWESGYAKRTVMTILKNVPITVTMIDIFKPCKTVLVLKIYLYASSEKPLG